MWSIVLDNGGHADTSGDETDDGVLSDDGGERYVLLH
jgi:hypothetical protein